MKMRVIKEIGKYNYNIGSGPNHSGRRADVIPVGSIVEATTMDGWVGVTWNCGVDSYGNEIIHGDLGLAFAKYLAAL